MEALMDFFLWAVSRIPLSGLRSVGGFFGGLSYDVLPKYRKKILNNLERIGLAKELGRESSRHTGMLSLETAWIWGRSNKEIAEAVEFDPAGLEKFRSFLAEGRSIILMTPHIGGFEAIPVAIYEAALKPAGKTLSILYREPKNRLIRPFVKRSRCREGMDPSPADLSGVRKIVRAMRSGGVLGCLPDQVPGRGEGVWADFFGRKAFTMTFPMKMAKQFNAVCVVMTSVRRKEGGWKIYTDVMPEAATGDALVDAENMNHAIERAVRKFPEQYLWNYNRYKGVSSARSYANDKGHNDANH